MIIEIALGILLAVFVLMYWWPLLKIAYWVARVLFTIAVFGGLALLAGS